MKQKFTASTLNQSFERRSFLIGAVQGGLGLLLAARMGYIAVAENAKYAMEAESNRVNLTLIPPRRGWILDRNGKPLASNRADFRIDGPSVHGIAGVVNLFGIESPGLTASLAIADHVVSLI